MMMMIMMMMMMKMAVMVKMPSPTQSPTRHKKQDSLPRRRTPLLVQQATPEANPSATTATTQKAD
jgi:hypothetical protein